MVCALSVDTWNRRCGSHLQNHSLGPHFWGWSLRRPRRAKLVAGVFKIISPPDSHSGYLNLYHQATGWGLASGTSLPHPLLCSWEPYTLVGLEKGSRSPGLLRAPDPFSIPVPGQSGPQLQGRPLSFPSGRPAFYISCTDGGVRSERGGMSGFWRPVATGLTAGR